MSLADSGRRISIACSRETMLDTVGTSVRVVGRVIREPDETYLADVYFGIVVISQLFVIAQRLDDFADVVVCSRAVFVTAFQAHPIAPGSWPLLRGIHDNA